MKLRNALFYVSDMERSKKFFADLGMEITEDFGKFVSFATDDTGVSFSLNLADSPDKTPGKQTVIFLVSNIGKHYKQIHDKHIEVHTER